MVQRPVWTLSRDAITRGRFAGLLALALLLSACAGGPLKPLIGQQGGPPAAIAPQSLRLPAQDALRGTAAQSLLASADQAAADGRDQAASLYLERALRIAPGSSWLYKRMAELRLGEGRGHAAEGFARHALRNAPDDNNRYSAGLWELVAISLERQDKSTQASAARKKAASLMR